MDEQSLGSNMGTAFFLMKALNSEKPALACPGMPLPTQEAQSPRLVLAQQRAPLGYPTAPPSATLLVGSPSFLYHL